MLDVQFQVSNLLFSFSFHTLMVVPSSEGGEPYPFKFLISLTTAAEQNTQQVPGGSTA
jgi:hypothetical protein